DSNYFHQPETARAPGSRGRDAQWTQVNEAGLLADTVLAGGRARLSMSIDALYNVRFTNDPQKPNTLDFDGQAGASYRWPSGIWISGGYAYERRDDPGDFHLRSSDLSRDSHNTFVNVGFDRDVFFGTKLQF